MESPTNINDVFLEAEDVSEAPLSFGAAARAATERFDNVDLESEFFDRACGHFQISSEACTDVP